MRFKFNKIDSESVKTLSINERSDLLDLIIEEIYSGKKITTKIIESEKKCLQNLLEYGIISVVANEKMYFETPDKKHHLSENDFEKLLAKYSKENINDAILRFQRWENYKKNDRADIYLTINKWLNTSNKRVLSEDEMTFVKKSYDSYIKRTGISGDSNIKYQASIEKLLESGYKIEDIREYWLECIPKEFLKSDDSKYRRRATTVIKEFEYWYKNRK